MEVEPEELRAAARRWSALAEDLVEGVARARSTPLPTGDAGAEAALLLESVAQALSVVRRDVEGLVAGLLVTVREMTDTDHVVAARLRSHLR